MDIIDARSGRTVRVGDVVSYGRNPRGHNDDWQLLAVESANLFGHAVLVIVRQSDKTVHRVPAPVRWWHRGRVFPVIIAPT